MTHNDIYTKFMIEYDKALVTSSYPSLTEYEVATVLDKAYNALIALKVTGNNYRRVPFEADVKAISDLQPLVVSEEWGRPFADNPVITNQLDFNIPEDFLYYVGCRLEGELYKLSQRVRNICIPVQSNSDSYTFINGFYRKPNFIFELSTENIPLKLLSLFYSGTGVTDDNAASTIYGPGWYFGQITNTYVDGILQRNITVNRQSKSTNLEELASKLSGEFGNIAIWYVDSSGVGQINQDDRLSWSRSKTLWDKGFPYDQEVYRTLPCQIVDFGTAQRFFTSAYNMPWVKNPVCYIHGDWLHVVHEDDTISNYVIEKCVLTYIKKPASFVKHLVQGEQNKNFFDDTKFELNETMAEELISLGIAYALENIESPRLNSKLNMRGLEA